MTGQKKAKYLRDREELFREQQGLCAICNEPMTREDASVDHIIPRWMGGAFNKKANKRVVHKLCNNKRHWQVTEEDLQNGCLSPCPVARNRSTWLRVFMEVSIGRTALFQPFKADKRLAYSRSKQRWIDQFMSQVAKSALFQPYGKPSGFRKSA